MKTIVSFCLGMICLGAAWAQGDTLELATCQAQARAHHPLRQQQLLLETRQQLKDQSLAANFLPGLQLKGQATYLSDVITFPSLEVPGGGGVVFPEIPRAQYQLSLQLQQQLYDGGMTRTQRSMNELEHQLRGQQTEVQLFPVRQAVSQLYFGLLLATANEQVLDATRQELTQRLSVLNAQVAHGVLLANPLDALKKERLRVAQRLEQLRADKSAMWKMLSLWTGEAYAETAVLAWPQVEEVPASVRPEQRPEQKAFDLQQQQLELGKQRIRAQRLPQLSAFASGGIGQPNPLNFLETNTQPFYQLGVQLQWRPWHWGNHQRERQVLAVEQRMLQQQAEGFENKVAIEQQQDLEQVRSLERQLAQDEEIIRLQTQIQARVASQLEHGTATSTDYLSELHQLQQARLNRELHRLQRLQALVNLHLRSGASLNTP